MRSIVIITCWYGPYPWYFPYYIHSCSYNTTIDFIIVTDNTDLIPNKPDNVKIVYQTLDDIVLKATGRLGFKVNIDYPYKLCDIKPAYGFLFPTLIRGYDFWGYCDIDIVYGNIRGFLNDETLRAYDIFSFRPEYMSGALSIFRNIAKVNNLFMKSKDYQKVFKNEKYFNFDECGFLFTSLWDSIPIGNIPSEIESMTHIVKLKAHRLGLRPYFDFNMIEGDIGDIKWENGKIVYKEEFEAILYHLLKFKENCVNKEKLGNRITNGPIYFTSSHIYLKDL